MVVKSIGLFLSEPAKHCPPPINANGVMRCKEDLPLLPKHFKTHVGYIGKVGHDWS